MIARIQKYATGQIVFWLFSATLSVYVAILFHFIPSVLEQAPKMKLFDMSPGGYTHADAMNLLEAIGPSGRHMYLKRQLPIDFIYPGLFAVTYTLMLAWLFRKSFAAESKVFFLTLVPAGAGLFDYLENLGILIMLKSFPELSPGLVQLSSIFTISKSVLTIAFYVLLLFGLLSVEKNRKRVEKSNQ